MSISKEERLKIVDFYKACDEMIEGRFILSDTKVSNILKCVVKSELLYNLYSRCMRDFNFHQVLDRSIASNPANGGYFVMTDDVFSVKYVGKLLQFLLNPIPFKKASTDFTILRTCRQVVSEGGSIAIFPEGNRTYSGKTEYIKPSLMYL